MADAFTYKHFIQAFQSNSNDMLMIYIDEAVGIYCNVRGITIGPRPANYKDYSLEYSDAFHTAMNAVYKVYSKIGSYKPSKDKTFRSYLHTALERAIIDILREEGRGDFFNSVAHRKRQGSEPETHIRVDADSFGGLGDGTRPDGLSSEEADRERRIREHQEDALKAVKAFIDTLPAIQRAAIYASSFGAGLRPVGEDPGRNYAEALAAQYNTTALYIRQLVNRGMKKVVAEAHRQGFSEESMTGISMGFIQARSTAPNAQDKVLKALDELDGFHQFLLLRHLAAEADGNDKNDNNQSIHNMSAWGEMMRRGAGEEARKEDQAWDALVAELKKNLEDENAEGLGLWDIIRKGENSSAVNYGIEITDEKGTLQKDETLLLKLIAAVPFTLGVYNSLEELITHLKVKIIIDPDTKVRYHSSLSESKKEQEYWQKKLEELKDKKDSPEYKDAEKMSGYYGRQVGIWERSWIFGEYIHPLNDGDAPVIKLYPNVIREKYKNAGHGVIGEYLAATFVHELMHAYFDRPLHSRREFLHFYSDEEPMAEFGTLLFFFETKQNWLFKRTYGRIAHKRNYYRYGAALMDRYRRENAPSMTREDFEMYRTRKY